MEPTVARKIPSEIIQLLQELQDERPSRGSVAAKAVGAVIGGVVGAGLGSVILLIIFGWALGEDGQGGLAAVLLGIPIGAWLGAELGAREASQ